MRCEEVVELYQALEQAGLTIWIDGGWAVDAHIGHQTRGHSDLDIAVEAKDLAALLRQLEQRGFARTASAGISDWNFVMSKVEGQKVDIHVVALDEMLGANGEPRDGIAYPAGSLTGEGALMGVAVRCVRADILLQLKASYPPRPVDRHDVAALCRFLEMPTPKTHL